MGNKVGGYIRRCSENEQKATQKAEATFRLVIGCLYRNKFIIRAERGSYIGFILRCLFTTFGAVHGRFLMV